MKSYVHTHMHTYKDPCSSGKATVGSPDCMAAFEDWKRRRIKETLYKKCLT